MLIRSVGPDGLRLPHTGVLQYTSDAPKIPAAAVTSEDADRLQRMVDRGSRVVVRLKMEAHFEPDAMSANVIGEWRGREKPDEIVVVGGHLDSWDVGAGATDDGGGCVVTWEALRLMKRLGLRPRRTVRVVLFTNEENGTRGGQAYRDAHRAELANHVMMLESDLGVFRPRGFGLHRQQQRPADRQGDRHAPAGIGADRTSRPTGGGADDGTERRRRARIPSMSLESDDSRVLQLIHHTAGRHRRQDRSARDVEVRRGDRGHGVCGSPTCPSAWVTDIMTLHADLYAASLSSPVGESPPLLPGWRLLLNRRPSLRAAAHQAGADRRGGDRRIDIHYPGAG